MARRSSNETTSDLYIRLGLSLDELESGFVDAERTIRDNMSRLHRENMIIDMQMKVELTGLDAAADAERILQIRTDALNRQIANQRDRVHLAAAEMRNMTERTGENSVQTQRARLTLEHHRLVLAQLEDQLAHLNDTQEGTSEETLSISEAFDAFARQCWNVIGVAELIGSAISNLVEHFRELQTQSYELNLDFNTTKQFLRQMRLAGGDIGDFEGYIRGITDAFVKGEWDDPEFLALSKYGAQITDATGRLKNFQQITEEVYQAWKKADEAGEGIEFLQLTGGESGIRDAIQYFKRYEEAKEDAEKIFDAGIEPEELHEADRALNLLTEQCGELKDALVNLVVPKVTQFMLNFFEVVRAGTKILVEFKDQLQQGSPIFSVKDLGEDEYASFFSRLFNDDAFENQKQLQQTIEETTKSWADFKKECEKGMPDANPLSQYALKRIKDFRDELEELRIELDYADNDYQQALAKLELWKKNELNDKLFVSDDERVAIEELYSAKLEEIEKDRADKLEEIREKVAQEDQKALEKKLAKIDKEKDEWISAGMEEAEALTLAEKQKNDAILELEQEFEEARDALGQTGLEKALSRIEKEKEAWIQKGIDEARATELAEQKKTQAYEDLDKEFNKALNSFGKSALQQKLDQIAEQRQKWLDKGIDEVRAEQWAIQAQFKARFEEYQKEKKERLQARAEQLRIEQEFEDKLASLRRSNLENTLVAIEKERNAWVQKGIDEAHAATMAAQERVNAERNAALQILKNQLKEWRIFQTEGYEGLQKHYLQELHKQGISLSDLQQMTSEKLHAFDKASDIAQRSLLPNFMSDYDKRLESMMKKYGAVEGDYNTTYSTPELDLINRQLAQLNDSVTPKLIVINDQLEQIQHQVGAISSLIEGVELSDFFKGVLQSLDEQSDLHIVDKDSLRSLAEQYGIFEDNSKFKDSLQALRASAEQHGIFVDDSEFQRLNDKINAFSSQMGQIAENVGDLGREATSNPSSSSQTSNSPTTPNITNTVNIQEAHAWDSEHINELANRVADNIQRALVGAIGGDDNSY